MGSQAGFLNSKKEFTHHMPVDAPKPLVPVKRPGAAGKFLVIENGFKDLSDELCFLLNKASIPRVVQRLKSRQDILDVLERTVEVIRSFAI